MSQRSGSNAPQGDGFDTGFVTFVRGWQEIRDDDRGLLWEHLVLDVLRASVGSEGAFYWRDKSGREVDFVVREGRQAHAIECKISPDRFSPETLRVFRQAYPRGQNYLVCPGISEPYSRRAGSLTLRGGGLRPHNAQPEEAILICVDRAPAANRVGQRWP